MVPDGDLSSKLGIGAKAILALWAFLGSLGIERAGAMEQLTELAAPNRRPVAPTASRSSPGT